MRQSAAEHAGAYVYIWSIRLRMRVRGIRQGLTSSQSFLSFGSEKTKVDRDIDEFGAPTRIPLLLDLVTGF